MQKQLSFRSLSHSEHSFLPVVAVALREDEREEQLEDDFAVVDAVAGHVRHEPVPKLRQGPGTMHFVRRQFLFLH